ncbi:MAG: LysM domain-containing protein [Desulfatiglandales bacterium]
MRNQPSAKKSKVVLCLAVLLVFLFWSAYLGAQPRTHTVQRGDTLWDICQTYYGNSNLWPKLWEMNPFVTNPHLLKPGDILTLFEDVSEQKKPIERAEKILPPKARMEGLDVSGLTKPEAMGYFSLVNVEGWGFIEATTSSKLGLTQGDTAFVRFEKNADTIRRGQEFSIVTASPMVRHPLTDRPLGFIVATRGKLVIKERLKDDHFRAEVSKVFSEVGVGSLIMPPTPTSCCILPMATDPMLYGNIVALKENQQVVGQFSVVYLDSGFKDGVKQGSVFELVKMITVPSPNPRVDSFEKIAATVTETLSKQEYLADFWKELQEGVKIYEQSVGKIIVVEARADSSTAVVLESSREMERGAFVKGVSWAEIPEYLSHMPTCPLE